MKLSLIHILTHQGCDIVFSHVSFSYQSGETVLRDVSFTAKQGQVTALVVPSGGGKTTVSRLAARFWDIDQGKITVGGMDVSQIDPEKLMSLYAIVFQDCLLYTSIEGIDIAAKAGISLAFAVFILDARNVSHFRIREIGLQAVLIGGNPAAEKPGAAGITGVEPVSYTHLDVYKRQIIW